MRFFIAARWTGGLKNSFLNHSIVNSNYTYFLPITCHSFQRFISQFVKNENISLDSFTSINNVRNFATTNAFLKSKDKEKKNKSGKPQKIDHSELSQVINVDHLTSNLAKCLDDLKLSFVKNLTLRSSAGAIEQLNVTFDGQDYMLQELVEISKKPKTVVLNAISFPQAIPQVLETLNKSGMNLNPQQDGTTIFIPIPKVTKEHRENLSKNAKALYIKHRDHMKDVRNKEIKNLKKKPSVGEDTSRRVQMQIELLTDQYIKEAEKILENKQKELLGDSE